MLRAVKQEFSIDRQRRSYAQALSGPVVDLIGNSVELLLAVAREIRALGQVLAHQAVGVLVGAKLPRAVGVTEVHRDARAAAQVVLLAEERLGRALVERLMPKASSGSS